MNIEIVTYTHLLKNVKRINFEGLYYTDDKAPPRYSKFYLWRCDTRKRQSVENRVLHSQEMARKIIEENTHIGVGNMKKSR